MTKQKQVAQIRATFDPKSKIDQDEILRNIGWRRLIILLETAITLMCPSLRRMRNWVVLWHGFLADCLSTRISREKPPIVTLTSIEK